MITSHLKDLPILGVSHDPEIKKKVMLSNGVIPKLTNFSQSVFLTGQTCTAHTHADMWEVYLVTSGTLTITVEGQTTIHEAGACVTVEPGEEHQTSNQHYEDLVLTYFGIEE